MKSTPASSWASLRDGGPADFVLIHGDPRSDPSALWRVWRVSWALDPVVI